MENQRYGIGLYIPQGQQEKDNDDYVGYVGDRSLPIVNIKHDSGQNGDTPNEIVQTFTQASSFDDCTASLDVTVPGAISAATMTCPASETRTAGYISFYIQTSHSEKIINVYVGLYLEGSTATWADVPAAADALNPRVLG